MIINELFLVKDKVEIFDSFNVDVEILTNDKYVGIEMIDEFKQMENIDFLKKVVKIKDIVEYDDYVVTYRDSDKKGYMRANGSFKRLEKVGIDENDDLDTKINTLINNKDKIELIWFNAVKINTTNF